MSLLSSLQERKRTLPDPCGGASCPSLLPQHHVKTQRVLKNQEPTAVHVCAQLCLTLCDSMDCSLPGSCVHGILQARILEWVTVPIPEDLPNPGI